MAFHYRTLGIILKKRERGEADQIFTVYTKDFGKLEILGKGIRKITSKLRPGIDTFYFSELEFIQGKRYKTLTDASLIDRFEHTRQDLKRLAIAFKVVNVIDRLIQKQDPDQKTWSLFKEFFDKLNKLDSKISNIGLIYYYFLWNLLSFLGYQIDLYNCVFCQKKLLPGKIYFSSKDGGLICLKCFQRSSRFWDREIDSDIIKVLRMILKKNWDTFVRLRIDSSCQKTIEAISKAFISSVLPPKF